MSLKTKGCRRKGWRGGGEVEEGEMKEKEKENEK